MTYTVTNPVALHDLLEIVAGIEPDHALTRRELRAAEFCREARREADQAPLATTPDPGVSPTERRAARFLEALDKRLADF